jgi:hypothetical protein
MTFRVGQSGNPNGRPKGSTSKQTKALAERLEALGCDPIEGMARIAMDESQPMALRASMYRELAQYVAPKRKTLEHSGETGGHAPPVFVIDIGAPPQADGTITREQCDKAAIGDPAFSLSGAPRHMP